MARLSIKAIAENTKDGYSFDRYGITGWKAAIKALRKAGLNDIEVCAWMLSKETRWAADCGSDVQYGNLNGAKIVSDYIAQYPRAISKKSLAELVEWMD